eukprot:COSAG01_NODE_54729_length_330_cov_0.666667_1_plen_23_part_01
MDDEGVAWALCREERDREERDRE